MVIAVLSDTHISGLDLDFTSFVEAIAPEVDHFFHIGDAVSREVLDFLGSFSLTAVAGNMDPPEITAHWPAKRMIELGGRRFGLIHGWGSPLGLDKRVLAEFEDVDCICFGHSHRALMRQAGPTLLFNPGSARRSFGRAGSYGRLTVTPAGVNGQLLPFGTGD